MIVLLFCFISAVVAQFVTSYGNNSISLIPTNSIQPYIDTAYSSSPASFLSICTGNSNIYTLSSSNIVEVYSKAHPNILYQTFTTYSFANFPPYVFVNAAVDDLQTTIVLTSYNGGNIVHLVHEVANNQIGNLLNQTTGTSISTPDQYFMKGGKIYSYLKSSGRIHVADLINDLSYVVDLGISDCTMAMHHLSDKALFWEKKSRVHIFSIPLNFTLVYIFNLSVINPAHKTDMITFSNDGKEFLIQTDQFSDMKIVNLTDYSVSLSLNIGQKVISTSFLDSTNRYIYIETNSGSHLYDRDTNTLSNFNGTLGATSTITSPDISQLYSVGSSSIQVYGIVATEGSTTAMNYLSHEIVVSSTNSSDNTTNTKTNSTTNTTSNNTMDINTTTNTTNTTMSNTTDNTTNNTTNETNTTISNTTNATNDNNNTNATGDTTNGTNTTTTTNTNTSTNSTNTTDSINNTNTTSTTNTTSNNTIQTNTSTNTSSVEISPFIIKINYTQSQNQTLQTMEKMIMPMNSAVQKIFSVIFSTPLAGVFMSLFSYFTLSSIYVLLNMTIPDTVYNYLQKLYYSGTADLLTQVGVGNLVRSISDEKVDDEKPINFGISSDLISTNWKNILLVIGNVIMVQIFIVVTGSLKICQKASEYLVKYRKEIYMGLILSKTPEMFLPYRYVFKRGQYNFSSKMTSAAQIIIYGLLPFLLIVSLINQLKSAKKKGGPWIRLALMNWWPSYQIWNFSFLVLFRTPLYFMIFIGISHCVNFYLSFFQQTWKVLAVIKASYFLMLHSCFVIFMVCSRNDILAVTSLAYLGILLAGAMHHFLQSLIQVLVFVVKATIWKRFNCLKVQPIQEQVVDKTIGKMLTIRDLNQHNKMRIIKTESDPSRKVHFSEPSKVNNCWEQNLSGHIAPAKSKEPRSINTRATAKLPATKKVKVVKGGTQNGHLKVDYSKKTVNRSRTLKQGTDQNNKYKQ